MARFHSLTLVAALCFLYAVSAARPMTHFIVQGRVYCDTCRAGFETTATTYIPGAKVRVECRLRSTGSPTYNAEGLTDETGTYKITVNGEHENEICEAVLVSSPQSGCSAIESGRERARVVLTHNNGIDQDYRFANNLGFLKDKPFPFCAQVLKQYQTLED